MALRALPGAGCARLNAHTPPWWVLCTWPRPPSLNSRRQASPSSPRGGASFPLQDCAGNDLSLPPTPVSEAYPQPGQPVPPAPFLGHHLGLPSSQCLTVWLCLTSPALPVCPSESPDKKVMERGVPPEDGQSAGSGHPPGTRGWYQQADGACKAWASWSGVGVTAGSLRGWLPMWRAVELMTDCESENWKLTGRVAGAHKSIRILG